MKKFIVPEVSSVELAQTDVIMDSTFAMANKVNYSSVITDSTEEEFEMWKGFNAQ